MKIEDIYTKLDKNNDIYIQVVCTSKDGKQFNCILTHYDLEYAVRSKIRYTKNSK